MMPRPQREAARESGRWKNGPVPVIGIVGGIGSGKSVVSAILAGRGALLIDADAVGHELLNDPEVREQLVERFGAGILTEPGCQALAKAQVDRRAVAALVFADAASLRALEAILHPRMRARFRAEIERGLKEGRWRCIVLDAAVLLEAGWDELCDLVVFVDAPRAERIRRVAGQRGWSLSVFESRERAQWPCDEKRRRAQLVLSNDDGVEQLHKEVERLEQLLEPCGAEVETTVSV